VFTADGGHRVCPPAETVDRLSRHISPITGVVKGLERFRVEPEGLVHYYVSAFPFYAAEEADELHSVLVHRGGGKGATDIQARASALCESIERYSALYPDDSAVAEIAAFGDVKGEAVHPCDLLLFSDNQYRTREEFNRRFPVRYHVPEPFSEDHAIRWTRVWSLTAERTRLIPTQFAYFGAHADDDHRFCLADSNGNATGNCLEEAILHGLLEVVERDSTAIWWYNRLRRPAVALEEFDEPYLPQLARWYCARNRELWVLDITSDLGIPTFGALSRRTDGPPESITMGFGAHLDARIAVLRAVTELNQSNVLCRAFGDLPAIDGDDALQHDWMIETALSLHPSLAPADDLPARTCDDYPELAGVDLKADVETCIEILGRRDLEVLVLDQSLPDIELNAVKVIVPRLVHVWHRLAPGRLFEAPVHMGLSTRQLDESDLNPTPFPI
jgi:ribosomal protein S12 methylthiotransferase accessory factor